MKKLLFVFLVLVLIGCQAKQVEKPQPTEQQSADLSIGVEDATALNDELASPELDSIDTELNQVNW